MKRIEDVYSQRELMCTACNDESNPETERGHKCTNDAPYGGECMCDGIHFFEPKLLSDKIAEAEKAISELVQEIGREVSAGEDKEPGLLEEAADEPNPDLIEETFSMDEPGKGAAAELFAGIELNPMTCPTCNSEKIQKERAVEASHKAEMILVIREIVGRFKNETDTRLTSLSNKVTAHINTIVAASNDLTITKHDLDLSLIRLEGDLREAFGITETLDPKAAGEAMFLENEEGEPLDMFDEPALGEDAMFDALTNDVTEVLEAHEAHEMVESAMNTLGTIEHREHIPLTN